MRILRLILILPILMSCNKEHEQFYEISQNILRFSVHDKIWQSKNWRDEVSLNGRADSSFGLYYSGSTEGNQCNNSSFILSVSKGIKPGDTLYFPNSYPSRVEYRSGYNFLNCFREYDSIIDGMIYCSPYSTERIDSDGYLNYHFGATFEFQLLSSSGDTIFIEDGMISVVE